MLDVEHYVILLQALQLFWATTLDLILSLSLSLPFRDAYDVLRTLVRLKLFLVGNREPSYAFVALSLLELECFFEKLFVFSKFLLGHYAISNRA